MKKRRDRPYWLSEGSVTCVACEHGVVLEAVFHCAACDRPLCGECVLLDPATGEVLCRACRDAPDAPDSSEGAD